MASTIHPKSIRTKWLPENGEPDRASINETQVKQHIRHMFHRPLLITGHPRCSTGFATSLCGQMGFEISLKDWHDVSPSTMDRFAQEAALLAGEWPFASDV